RRGDDPDRAAGADRRARPLAPLPVVLAVAAAGVAGLRLGRNRLGAARVERRALARAGPRIARRRGHGARDRLLPARRLHPRRRGDAELNQIVSATVAMRLGPGVSVAPPSCSRPCAALSASPPSVSARARALVPGSAMRTVIVAAVGLNSRTCNAPS